MYGNGKVVLYSVPADIFKQLQYHRATPDIWDENTGVLGQSDLIMDSMMTVSQQYQVEGRAPDFEAGGASDCAFHQSLHMTGSVVIHVGNKTVDKMAVQSENGGLSIWILYRSGLAELHSIYTKPGHQVTRRLVGDNGLLLNREGEHEVTIASESQPSKGKEKADEESKHVTWAG